MYMGVAGRPNAAKNFNSKILLKRVAKKVDRKKTTHSYKFIEEANLNTRLKAGCWRECYMDQMTLHELWDAVQEAYQMKAMDAECITFHYKTYIGKKGNTKWVTIHDEQVIDSIKFQCTDTQKKVLLKIEDVHMMLVFDKEDQMDEDINCDSQYMLNNIREIGQAIRTSSGGNQGRT